MEIAWKIMRIVKMNVGVRRMHLGMKNRRKKAQKIVTHKVIRLESKVRTDNKSSSIKKELK